MEEVDNLSGLTEQDTAISVAVDVEDLRVIRDTLRWAWRHHVGRDIMDAATHMAETQPRPLTSQLENAFQLMRGLLEDTE
jgi:hypothetical protein